MDPGLVGDLLLHQRGAHVGRADRVGGDAAPAALERDHLGQPLQAMLGRDVGGLERRGAQAVYRGDVDDPAEALLVHVRQRRPGQPERGFQHHREDQPEFFRRELVHRGHVLQARAVHQDVGLPGQRRRVEVGGQVHLDGPSADAAGDRGGGTGVEVGDHDGGPVRGQPGGAGLADAAGPAGDHGHPPGQVLTHAPSHLVRSSAGNPAGAPRWSPRRTPGRPGGRSTPPRRRSPQARRTG